MATFEITTPDGRVFEVVGKDAQGAAAAVKKMLSSQPQQGGQQQTQPQQDDRSFPRAIADVGASFAGAVPKAAGAMVSIGSQVPVLNKVADPIAQSLMNAGEFVDDALLSDYQKNMNADMANAVAKSAIQLGPDATISDHIENMKSQGGAAAKFIMENPSQALMLTSQALPYLVGGGIIGRGVAKLAPSTAGATAGAIGEGSIAAGAVTGDIIAQLEAEGIEGYTPDRLAALPAGVLTAVIGRMGAKVNQKLGGVDVDTAIAGGGTGAATRGLSPKGAAIGGTTELGEEFLQSAQEQAFTNIGTGDPISAEVGSSAVQGAAAGFGMGSVIGSNVMNAGSRDLTEEQMEQRAVSADVARKIRKVADNNGYSLDDINPTSGNGARQALEEVRNQQVRDVVNLAKKLKKQLDPRQAETLEQLLMDYSAAEAAIAAGKRKVSTKVTTDQYDAVKRLVTPYKEGNALLQTLLGTNVVTDLFKDGMKGGLSQWTDLFNPLLTSGHSYDPTRVGNVVLGGLPLLSSNGSSLIPQAAIVLGGQAIDKVLGGKGGTRRKLVKRFVKLNEGNDGLGSPTGPSLIAQAQQAERDEKQEAEAARIRKQQNTDAFNQMDGIEFNKSPLGTLYLGTGLNQAGLEALLAHIEQHYSDKPAVSRWIDETRRNLAGEENQIEDNNKWIGALNGVLNTDASLDALREDQPDNPLAQRARRRAGFGPSTAQSTAGTAQQQQPQGPSAAVQSGIDANNALADRLLNGMESDQSIPDTQKKLLRTALLEFGARTPDGRRGNIGANGQPLENALAIVERLRASGVMPRYINDYIMPYVQRVAQQNAGRSGRQQPPTSTGTDLAFDEDFAPRSPDIIDNKSGLGQVPYNMDVDYRGARVLMKPSTFATLASSRNGEPAVQFVKEHLQQGGKIGAPFLQVDLDNADSPKVTSHEGRSRMLGVLETYGDVPIEVHLFPLGKRARDLSPTMIKSLQNNLVGQDGNTVQGPLFSPAPTGGTDLALDEDFDTPRSPSNVSVMEYPIAPIDEWYGEANYQQTGGKIKNMSPDDFLSSVRPLDIDEASRDNIDDLKNHMMSGRTLDPLTIFADGKEDGRHRAVAAKELGIQEVPVIIFGDPSGLGSLSNTDLALDEDFDASQPALTDNVPTGEVSGTPLENSLARSFDFARRKVYTKGRDFKLDLQAKSLASQKSAGIDLTQVTPENIDRLADFVYADALEAIKDNQNAIGWYDRTVTEALETLGEVYPEVLTSPKHKLQFVWALAVTSNGLKVDKNFELAAEVYETLQRTGRFPSKAGIGTAAKGINSGLKMYHTMLDKFDGDHVRLADFMNSQVPVRTIEKEYKVDVTGEGKGTLVRGASILGPKIGNGFFSNLYGNFDALTMDRWLMRTVGRWRGTLVVPNPAMEKKKRGEIKDLINGLSNAERRVLRKLYSKAPVTIKPNMSVAQLNAFAQATAKLSMDPAWREVLNLLSPEIRKSGNGLSGYLDGQQEAPKGAAERNYIREVFTRALGRLQDEPAIRQNSNQQLTMSDLQALLWYPEKRLYDTAKQTEGNESRGYEDDDAPDYANAARKVVEAIKQRDGLGSLSGDGRGGRGPTGPDAGQSFDQDLAQQGNTGVLATPPAQQPQPNSPFNMASLVNKMLGSQPATPDQVKAQLPFVRPAFEIGKAGTKYADGIQDIDSAIEFAKAINVTLKMFDSQQEMFDALGYPIQPQVRGAYREKDRTVFGMNPNAKASKQMGEVTTLDSLTTVLHEVGHAAAKDSGFESLIERMMQDNSEYSDSVRKRVFKEIDNIQKNVDLYVENNPKQRRPVRKVMAALQARKNNPKLTPSVNRFLAYVNQADERAVDPVLLYFVNPRLAKAVAPTTSQLVKESLNAAGNQDFQLYTYPFATMVAVVLAMMLNGRAEEEEEEQRQQMPAGALSPQAGALSQQQFAA